MQNRGWSQTENVRALCARGFNFTETAKILRVSKQRVSEIANRADIRPLPLIPATRQRCLPRIESVDLEDVLTPYRKLLLQGLKRCTICGEIKLASRENYHYSKGLMSPRCTPCYKQYQRTLRTNKEGRNAKV